MKNWKDIRYLLEGDQKQKEVYAAIRSCRAMELLSAFDAMLTGTYPIGIYLPASDIDIICCFSRKEFFENVVSNAFGHLEGFSIKQKTIRGEECLIARFFCQGFLFEIFGQKKSVEEQFAYRHMTVEYHLLSQHGDTFRKEVVLLKEKGLSTEEAFCSLLGIEGDPYLELLKLEN